MDEIAQVTVGMDEIIWFALQWMNRGIYHPTHVLGAKGQGTISNKV